MTTWGEEKELDKQKLFLRMWYGQMRMHLEDAPGGANGFARRAMLLACDALHAAAETIDERQAEMILEAKTKNV